MKGIGKLPGRRTSAERAGERRTAVVEAAAAVSAAGNGAGREAVITSRDNRWLKLFRMALRGGLPAESGAVGVEGLRLVEEALQSGCAIDAVLFSGSGERFRERLAPLIAKLERGIPMLGTTDRLFAGIADTEHPQGVAALVQPRSTTLDDLLQTRANAGPILLVVLAGVQDPGNVGTILRTAAAFGATGAVSVATSHSGTASPYAPKALRASAGAALHLPLLTGMSLPILLTQLKIRGVRIFASSTHKASVGVAPQQPPLLAAWDVDWLQPAVLLIGNEGAGLPEEIECSADARIHIPISSGIDSLNAAAAAAVLLYEAARQRNSVAQSTVQREQAPQSVPDAGSEPFRLT